MGQLGDASGAGAKLSGARPESAGLKISIENEHTAAIPFCDQARAF